jgi:polyhydroxyalkanoate synthesis regulator phasin
MPKQSSLKIIEPTIDSTSSLGNRIRDLTQKLRQEDEIQKKATAKILGAAAQMAENYDRLVDEVVAVVETDLATPSDRRTFSIEPLKQQFKTLKAAADHYQVKASSWQKLVEKLNASSTTPANSSSASLNSRLDTLTLEVQQLRRDMDGVLDAIAHLTQKSSS